MEAVTLTINKAAQVKNKANKRGRILGLLGVGFGFLGAITGITFSLLGNHITYGEAGMYYGIVGALSGISFASIGILSSRLSTD